MNRYLRSLNKIKIPLLCICAKRLYYVDWNLEKRKKLYHSSLAVDFSAKLFMISRKKKNFSICNIHCWMFFKLISKNFQRFCNWIFPENCIESNVIMEKKYGIRAISVNSQKLSKTLFKSFWVSSNHWNCVAIFFLQKIVSFKPKLQWTIVQKCL